VVLSGCCPGCVERRGEWRSCSVDRLRPWPERWWVMGLLNTQQAKGTQMNTQ
jgi:hypothetical protein